METTQSDNFITDEQLLILLDSKEVGLSFPDSLAKLGTVSFTENEMAQLRQIWDLHGNLIREAHNISPNEGLLISILGNVPTSSQNVVTNPADIGYNGQSAEVQSINIYNTNTFMQMNWKIVAPIAVLVIVVAAAVSMGNNEPSSLAVNTESPSVTTTTSAPEGAMMAMEKVPATGTTETSEGAMMAMEKKQTPAVAVPATGDVDTLVSSLLAEADGDKTLLNDASSDISLVTADSQSLTDLNNAYNETTF